MKVADILRVKGNALARRADARRPGLMHNDWVAAFEVDLDESRDAGHPALRLCRLGSLA